MANVYAVKSGNWSDTTVWNTGALPTSADDVYSNNFTVTVDISPTVLSVRNGSASGINAGGSFNLNNGITFTSTNGFISSGSNIINYSSSSGQTSTLNGNFGVTTGNATLVSLSGSGTLNINGNMSSGGTGGFYGMQATGSCNCNLVGNANSNGGPAINWNSSGTLTVTGSVFGTSSSGINNGASGTVNINVLGSITTSGAGAGVNNSSTGTINITGLVTSASTGAGVNNASTGIINITGTATGGSSTGSAFNNSSTGTITHIGTAQASATAPAIGAGAVGQVTILTGPLLSTDETYTGGASASGVNPCIAQRWFPKDTALSTFKYTMRAQSVAGIRSERSFYHTSAYTSTYPIVSNVRRNINYGPVGIYTGTMDIPNPQTVGYGVGVGTVTGTALFSLETLWGSSLAGITSAGSIGDRLKTASTVASVAQQISDAFSAR